MPHKLKDTIRLIEESLEYEVQHKFLIDFAPLMEESNQEHCHILIDKNENVIGHIGVKERTFGNLLSTTQVALMGGIAIQKKFRGKGLFSYFFNYIESIYKQNNSMFILWSDLDDLYRKYNYHQAGTVIELGQAHFIDSDLNKRFTKENIKQLNVEDFKAIQSIYKSELEDRYTTLKRSHETWNTILKMSSVKFYTYRVNKVIKGYFFINKGQDLTNVIHESACLQEHKDQFILALKKYRLWQPVSSQLDSSAKDKKIFYSAIFKISNLEMFNHFFDTWSNHEAKVIKIDDGKIILKHKNNEFTVLESEFYSFLFGPSEIVEFESYGKPLFFSGLDSI